MTSEKLREEVMGEGAWLFCQMNVGRSRATCANSSYCFCISFGMISSQVYSLN